MDRRQSPSIGGTAASEISTGKTTNQPQHNSPSCTNSVGSSNGCSPINAISSSSSSTTSSLPQYSEDIRRTTATAGTSATSGTAAAVSSHHQEPSSSPHSPSPSPALDFLARQSSASSSTKTCEVDLGDEERDTFSPVSSSCSSTHNSPYNADCSGNGGVADIPATSNDAIYNGPHSSNSTSTTALVDNKVFDGNHHLTQQQQPSVATHSSSAFKVKLNHNGGGSNSSLHHSTTKEEKQRQNEEIVIMETSSISSETGSWESVYPHASNAAAVHVPTSNAELLGDSCLVDTTSHNIDCKIRKQLSQQSPETPKTLDKSKALTAEELRPPIRDESNLFRAPNDVIGLAPYLRERTYSTGAAAVTADTSSLFAGGSVSSLLPENQLATSITSSTACFIDASSLRDEDEVLSFPSLDGQPSNDGIESQDKLSESHENLPHHQTEHARRIVDAEDVVGHGDGDGNSNGNGEVVGDDDGDESPTKKLETFHKSFAKCKIKMKESNNKPANAGTRSSTDADLDLRIEIAAGDNQNDSASNSCPSSSADSPEKIVSTASPTSANNLSDEEKLWKRELDTRTRVIRTPGDNDVEKDAQQHLSAHEDVTESSVSLAADFDSSDSSDIVKLRREQKRKLLGSSSGGGCAGSGSGSGSFVFHHNLQQFSIHPLGVSPKFPVHSASGGPAVGATATHHSNAGGDHSYTTDYSSSPAQSFVWSEHESRPSTGSGATSNEPHTQKPCLLPETPHNSIVHIDAGSSNASSIHRDYTPSSSFSHQRDSGAYCSDATDSPIPMPRTPKRSKFDEANPIVSGGASFKDFNIKQCESPPVKRRTETCPIVSGGFVSLDFESTRPIADEDEEVELRSKPKTRKPIPGIASWVVDMSDCRSERRKSTSSSSSLEIANGAKPRERSDSTSSHKSGCGFYVSLDDMDKKPDQQKSPMSKSFNIPKSTGFFIKLSKSEYTENVEEGNPSGEETQIKDEDPNDSRKNMFSMFIDIGEKKSNKKEPLNLASRLSSSLTSSLAQHRQRSEDIMKSSASSTETLMSRSSNLKTLPSSELAIREPTTNNGESKSLDYRCNLEPPITVAAIRRISQQQRAQNDVSKRHSWGNNPSNGSSNSNQDRSEGSSTHDYKRSISLTANGGDPKDGIGSGLMSIIDKIPLIAKTSSLSVDSSLSPYDEFTGSKSELSTSSNNSARNSMSSGERDDDLVGNSTSHTKPIKAKRHRRDVQINETFDKSSLASITDGVLSKDLSPASTTDTDDLTFQQDEELALQEAAAYQNQHQHDQLGQVGQLVGQSPVGQSQLLSTSNRSSAIIMETIIEARETSSPKKSASGHTLETLHATIEKQKMLLETVNEHGEAEKGNFVKLSDMDKPIKFELNSPEAMMSKSVGNHRQINRLFRDESKGRPHSWTMTRSTGNSFLNITNSVDNLRSLSRLFPNFSKEFSNSLPNDITLDHMDYIQTDISADSSLASSFSRSGMDESSISCRQPRRLGEDLLKMFLQEIATDMIVEVHGRRIKAHKCILRSRCQYFAAMLAGNGAQSVVSLQGYSYSAVHFALCHIYSGASHPPDGISLMELAALADLLGLEGLKEVTAHALKTNYCHNFHKPCSGCIEGILQVLPVALNHALDDLYRKCLRWTCRHYLKVWPTRQFAQLPPDILGRCRQQIVAYMTPETVLDTVLDCDNLLTQLTTFRWGTICENVVRDILDAAYAYIGDHFASLIASDSFLSLGHDRSCHIPHLEGVLLRTASSLTPDQACRSYQRVTRLNTVLQAKVLQMPPNLGELAKELQGLQEEDLDWDKEYVRLVSAILSAVEQCLIRQCSRAMRVTAWQRMDLDLRKKIQTLARLTEPIDVKRNSKPVSKAFSFGGSTRSQDLYQVKLAIQAHSKRALAQDTQLYKATQTHEAGNVETAERGVQANHDLREGTSKILKSNSRAHVPQNNYRPSNALQNTTSSERNSLHKRALSDGSAALPIGVKQKAGSEPKTELSGGTKMHQPQQQQQQGQQPQHKTPIRLADVRPRYLEPRKSRNALSTGPVRSATSSSIPATNTSTRRSKSARQISSSDSSRNSSPAAIRKANILNVKIGTKSTNMSLDSLSSPSRRGRSVMLNSSSKRSTRGKSSDTERYSDAGIDSLAESMKSSVVTNKTVSQDSLKNAAKLSRSNPLLLSSNKNVNFGLQDNSKPNLNGSTKINKSTVSNTTVTVGIVNAAPKHLTHHNIASTGSSPSSVNTTKSAGSRISSVSSTQSTRNVYKNRSISVPAGQQDNNSTTAGQSNHTTRRSFLSAKSREILARRAEKNKQLQLELEKQNQQHQQQNANSSGDEKTSTTSQRQSVGPLRSSSHSAVTSLATTTTNRQSLPSNIPTRRPNTLHLKKTNGVGLGIRVGVGVGVNSQKILTNGNKSTNIKLIKAPTTRADVKQNVELIIDNSIDFDQKSKQSDESTSPATQPLRIGSKLERSSTFCKDNSDLDLSELQIIE